MHTQKKVFATKVATTPLFIMVNNDDSISETKKMVPPFLSATIHEHITFMILRELALRFFIFFSLLQNVLVSSH